MRHTFLQLSRSADETDVAATAAGGGQLAADAFPGVSVSSVKNDRRAVMLTLYQQEGPPWSADVIRQGLSGSRAFRLSLRTA
jgi:hypothetical protein